MVDKLLKAIEDHICDSKEEGRTYMDSYLKDVSLAILYDLVHFQMNMFRYAFSENPTKVVIPLR